MYTYTLPLWIKGFQLFRNFMCDVTHHNRFGLVLTFINKVCKHKHFILENMKESYTNVNTVYFV